MILRSTSLRIGLIASACLFLIQQNSIGQNKMDKDAMENKMEMNMLKSSGKYDND